MQVKKCIKFLIPEILYISVGTFFLIKLSMLNRVLLANQLENVFELLRYNQYTPVKYFLFAIFWVGIGAFRIYWLIKHIRQEYNEILELLLTVIAVLIIIIFIFLIIKFIDNPILRAVIIAVMSLASIGFVISDS